MCCISSAGKSWNRSATTMRSAVSSASSPAMFELPGSMKPSSSRVKNTLALKPYRCARIRPMAGRSSSDRYSWSPEINTTCLPAPGPDVPSNVTRWGWSSGGPGMCPGAQAKAAAAQTATQSRTSMEPRFPWWSSVSRPGRLAIMPAGRGLCQVRPTVVT